MPSRHVVIGVITCTLVCTLSGAVAAGSADAVVTPRRAFAITVGQTGDPSGRATSDHAISASGRYIAFDSDATDVVPGDTNEQSDVFLKDTVAGTVERVSVTNAGGQLDGPSGSFGVSVSDDGRYVVFTSSATILSPDGSTRLYVRDRSAGTTTTVTATVGGSTFPIEGFPTYPRLSADGRYLAFTAKDSRLNPGMPDIVEAYRLDLSTGALAVVAARRSGQPGDGFSYVSSISADGRRVAFTSVSTNLVPGVKFSRNERSYVKDLASGALTLLDQPPGITPAASGIGSLQPVLSHDGQYATFQAELPNLPGGLSNRFEVYRRTLATGQIDLITIAPDGTPGDRDSYHSSISGDGRYVVFDSYAANLVPGDTKFEDVFVRDMTDGTTTVISKGLAGAVANDSSQYPLIAASGNAVIYQTGASNIVRHDLDHTMDLLRVALTRS